MHVLCAFLRRITILYVIGYRGHPIKKGKLQATETEREGERDRGAVSSLRWCSLPFGDNCQMQFFMASKLLEILFVLSIYNFFSIFRARALGQKASAKATAVKSAEIHWNDNKTKSCCCCFVFSCFFFRFHFFNVRFLLFTLPMASSILNFMVRTASMYNSNNNNNWKMLAKYLWNVFEVPLFVHFALNMLLIALRTCFSCKKVS